MSSDKSQQHIEYVPLTSINQWRPEITAPKKKISQSDRIVRYTDWSKFITQGQRRLTTDISIGVSKFKPKN